MKEVDEMMEQTETERLEREKKSSLSSQSCSMYSHAVLMCCIAMSAPDYSIRIIGWMERNEKRNIASKSNQFSVRPTRKKRYARTYKGHPTVSTIESSPSKRHREETARGRGGGIGYTIEKQRKTVKNASPYIRG